MAALLGEKRLKTHHFMSEGATWLLTGVLGLERETPEEGGSVPGKPGLELCD